MVFGSSQHSGIGGLKSALREEGAVSERMRLEHIIKERDKANQTRAKQSLEDKKRQLEHNKTEISHRETELRRVNSELTRAQSNLTSIEREMKEIDGHVLKLKTKHDDMVFEINKHREDLEKRRNLTNHEMQNIAHYTAEIHALELKMTREKEVIRHIDSEIEALSVKMAHLTNDASRAEVEVSRANSLRQYKVKEVENRKRAFNTLNDKKTHETSEIQRLHAEVARLEQEIRSLERTAK